MLRLYLIRHGETDWNRMGLLQGTTDIPLNQCGRHQAEALADRLAGVEWSAAYTSPLRRARETAEVVLRRSGRVARPMPELRELCYGSLQGRGPQSRARSGSMAEHRWRAAPWSVRFPGGESLTDLEGRAAAALAIIRAGCAGGNVLVSAHGHLNRVLLIRALGWERERFWEIDQPNGSCRVIEWTASGATLLEGV